MRRSLLSFLPGVDRGLKNMRTPCDNRTCHNTQLMRSIPGGKPGIQVGQAWYCSADCFAQAARETLTVLSFPRPLEAPRAPRLSMGLALHLKGALTKEQLQTVSAESQRSGEDFEATVLRLGLVTEQQIASARAIQWGYPVLSHDYVGHTVQVDVPRAVFEACHAAPLHFSQAAKRIVLGFVYRIEHSVLEAIEQMTGCRVEPCFMTATDFARQIELVTPAPNYQAIVAEPGPPEKMARTLGRAAVEIGARDARFVRYKNLVWARVTGKRGIADVVFRGNRVLAELRAEKSEIFEGFVAAEG